MAITFYTGRSPPPWRPRPKWVPNALAEAASVLTISSATLPAARVLLLTGVRHPLVEHSEISHKPGAIRIIKGTGDWVEAERHVQKFCEDLMKPPSGKVAHDRRPKLHPIVIVNDVDFWVSGGVGGLFTRTCDPALVERVNKLGGAVGQIGGNLIVMAVLDTSDERWSEVVESRRWGWRRQDEVPFGRPMAQAVAQQPPLGCSASAAVKSKRTRQIPDWCNKPDEIPPPSFPHGPLVGRQKDLASWVFPDGKHDRRRLLIKVQNKTVWVRMIHTYLYEAWFKNQAEFALANERRIVAEKQYATSNDFPQRSSTTTQKTPRK